MPQVDIAGIRKADGQTFVFIFRPEQKADAMKAMGRWASDNRLSFTWQDAEDLSTEIRKMPQVVRN